jgi:hypothetical protein
MSTQESRPTGAAPEIPAKASTDSVNPGACCRDTVAEIIREVAAGLVGIKFTAETLAASGDDEIMAEMMLDEEVETLLDRVRRLAWLHDLDHGRTR